MHFWRGTCHSTCESVELQTQCFNIMITKLLIKNERSRHQAMHSEQHNVMGVYLLYY